MPDAPAQNSCKEDLLGIVALGSLVGNLCQYIQTQQQDLEIQRLAEYATSIKRGYDQLNRSYRELAEQYGTMRKTNMELLEVVSEQKKRNDDLQQENAAFGKRIQELLKQLNEQQLRFDQLMSEKNALLKEIADLQQELALAGERTDRE